MKIRTLFLFGLLGAAASLPARALIREGGPSAGAARRSRASTHDQIAVLDNAIVDFGQVVSGDAIALVGSVRVEGTVEGKTAAIFGNAEIDGEVDGSVVALLGDIRLGPNAHVGGDVVCIGGHLLRDPGAVVDGEVHVGSIGSRIHILGPARGIWLAGFRHPGVWLADLALLLLYAFIAWLFPGGVRRCGCTLVHRPGLSALAALLTVLALPSLAIALIMTLVGIPVALFVLPAAVTLVWTFGKASFYALVGQALARKDLAPWQAVLAGGLVCLLAFLIPGLGLLLSCAISILMMGAVVVTLADSIRKQPSGRPPAEPPPLS